MNNTIEVFEEMKKDTVIWNRTTRTKALTKAIATLKVLESAEGLPEKKTYQNTNEWCDGGAYLAKGFNDCRDLCRIPYAKQILKNKELEEALNTLMNEVFSGQASMSSYGYKKAQRAKIKDIENG